MEPCSCRPVMGQPWNHEQTRPRDECPWRAGPGTGRRRNPRQAVLSAEQAGELAERVGRDLAKLVPQVAELDLVFAAAHFDPAEVLRPGWPIHRRLEELQMRAPGPRLLAFGTDAEGDVPLPFQADATLVGGGLRVVPFLLTGSDVATTSAVADALEETLLANGMAHADTALMAQNTFGARIEHARYFTVNDLAAMMSMQYDNQGLAALWPLIETAIMAPGEDEWLNAAPSRCCAIRMAKHAWRCSTRPVGARTTATARTTAIA